MDVKKIWRRTLESLLIPLTLAMPMKAQNQVDLHITSSPTLDNKYARITFTDMSSKGTLEQNTDSTTGNTTFNLPSGTYERKIETLKNILFKDTLQINSNQNMDVQMVENLGKESPFYTSFTHLLKSMTDTYFFGGTFTRWQDSKLPLKVNLRYYDSTDQYSMRPNYKDNADFALDHIVAKSKGAVTFQRVTSGADIDFIYVKSDSMPQPGVVGYTDIQFDDDLQMKHVLVYINKDMENIDKATFLREFMRSLGYPTNSRDPTFITYYQGASSDSLANDEGKILQITYKLRNRTKYNPFQDSTTTSITDVVELDKPLPQNFNLLQNYPNPFNPLTKIRYELKEMSQVKLDVYNTQGRLIETLVDGKQGAGTYEAKFSPKNMASGTYFYTLQMYSKNGLKKETKKMQLIK
jgi:hypothetical protein